MRDTIQLGVRVKDPHQLAFVDRIFKACEGLAMVTVPPMQKEYLILDYTPSTEDDVLSILEDLRPRLGLILFHLEGEDAQNHGPSHIV